MRSRDETKAWVRAVLDHLHMKPTHLAKKIGKVPSTLNRFLNDPDATHDLSRDTLDLIAELARVRPYELPAAAPRRAPGVAETEAAPLDPAAGTAIFLGTTLRDLIAGANSITSWVLRSTALSGVGYLPNDILVVDLNERPRVHDVVCAQVYDWSRGKAETIFRLYEPPYLLASTTDPKLVRPFIVDDDVVVVKGVVIASMRDRRALGLAA